jgi:hypothetical protein
MQCPSDINARTVRNFPIQSTGAEILHVACILAERRGIEVAAPVHDALLAEAPLDQIEDVSSALDRVMRDASATVLRGYELPTGISGIPDDKEQPFIRPGEHYFDDRGVDMWTVTRLVTNRERGVA